MRADRSIALAVILAGCSGAVTGTGPGHAGGEPMEFQAPGPLALYGWLVPGGTEPVPSAFGEAAGRFEQAKAEYEAGRWRAAARAFLDAAALLPRGPGPHSSISGADRGVSYRNAESSFQMAGDTEEARRTFEALAASDPDCAGPLGEILARLR